MRTARVPLVTIFAGVLLISHGGAAATPGRQERSVAAVAHAPAKAATPEIVRFAGGSIQVELDASEFSLSKAQILDWVRDSARATAAYFGRFPVPYVRLAIEPTRGAEVVMGRAVGRPEHRIVVAMGRHVTAADLAQESLLVHEMVHLAIPDHDIRYLWLHEGIATYVEHVARAQAGLISPAQMWIELMSELPSGLPSPRDSSGLDGTPSEGRRYWGGALFCLIADIEIRKATGNRHGLQDALRALQRQGGNLARIWTLERTLEVADRGTGTQVLTNLYRLMGNRAHVPDLAKVWRDLGLRFERGGVVLDARAPLADIRNAITGRPSQPLLVASPRLVRVVEARVAAGADRR